MPIPPRKPPEEIADAAAWANRIRRESWWSQLRERQKNPVAYIDFRPLADGGRKALAWLNKYVGRTPPGGFSLDQMPFAPRWLELPSDPPELRRELRRLAAEDARNVEPRTADLTDLLAQDQHGAAFPADAAGPAGLHDPAGQLNGHNRKVDPC